MKTKRFLIIFSTFVFILALVLPLLPLSGETDIYDEAIRLHVLANSDSEEDQNLKLKVRDNVLELVRQKIECCHTRYEAEQTIESNIAKIEKCAIETIKSENYDYPVKVTLTNEYYPTREYEDVRMPAGTYASLRILIGNAEGHNWWCVLYPPLCTSSAEPKKTLQQSGFSDPQIRVLTENENPKYVLKFRTLEFFEAIIEKIKN